MTIRCCVCKRILVQAGPSFPISDTVCRECYPGERAAAGLPSRAYPEPKVPA